MSAVRIDIFGGLNLVKDPKKPPFWSALKASNCNLTAGSIDKSYGFKSAAKVVLSGGLEIVQTTFNLDGSIFLRWSQNVDVALSPIADNSTKRFYYTGDDAPRASNLARAPALQASVSRSYVLGMPIPPVIRGSQLTVAGAGGAESRSYIYTMVSPWGEESAPSAPFQSVDAQLTGSTIDLLNIGVAPSRVLTAAGVPDGVPLLADFTFVALPVPGFLRAKINGAAYYGDFRVGDRVLVSDTMATVAQDKRARQYPVSAVNAGTGFVDFAANCWDNVFTPNRLWRVLPVNSYNIVGATKDTPIVGQIKIFVDTTEGLRKGETVLVQDVVGMTDLNGLYLTVVSVDLVAFHQPSFVVALATAQAYTSGGVARRTAPHNTGEVHISNVTIAAGVVTVTVDNSKGDYIAHKAIGDKALIYGIMGAYEANGLRTITSAPNGSTFTFALPAMTAYTGGGVVILADPYSYIENVVTNVVSGGGPYPGTPFTYTFTLTDPTEIKIGDTVLGYDIGGAVEANTIMVVQAVTMPSTVVCRTAQAAAAYTAGGKLVRVFGQMRKRIYRTATGTQTAEYQLVEDTDFETSRYLDKFNTTALGDVIESETWIQPPADMHSLVAHPHGFLVGASDRVLHLSEPQQPHAFPLKYQVPLPAKIIGIGITGNTIVALTDKVPYTVAGSHPEQMAKAQEGTGEPCTSHRSIANDTSIGVVYRGRSGLFSVGYQGSAGNATKDLLTRDIFPAVDTRTVWWNNKVIWVDAFGGSSLGYIFDPALNQITQFDVTPNSIQELHVSPIDGLLWAVYFTGGGATHRAPLLTADGDIAAFTYWSQHVPLDKPTSFAFLKVEWDWSTAHASIQSREATIVRNLRQRAGRYAAINDHAINAIEINGDELETVYTPTGTDKYVKVTVIASPNDSNATTVFDDYVSNEDPVAMDDGIEADAWQVKVNGNVKVSAVSLASTVEDFERV